MNFDDLKDLLLEKFHELKGNIQENPTFNTLKEKFETLSSQAQRAIIIGGSILFAFILFSIPYSYFSSASEYEASYQESKSIIRQLFSVSSANVSSSSFSRKENMDSLKTRFTTTLGTFRLLPTQLKGVNLGGKTKGSFARKKIQEENITVQLAQLNLTQALKIGSSFQNAFSNLRMTGLNLVSQSGKKGYFDVTYTFSKFYLPEVEEKKIKPSKKKGKRPRPKKK